ncbi:Amine oxidase [Nitrobacter winogradskyi Nb-255]|uniref:Tryptophan 2-monooxygenase n=1 Tax=Nitrobacter winogradskyi (strain ATCC 25391 / DSM 10237 / CIP 104748 / NCIMB 11846 / Nb-255) TaxID=323098 RepID=Q3SWL0_NITWN|nr:NAD(P)/FAD-dependent oxidoreductase [Nitrobacter winogradskyi]ABA03331.1 Amine oxidase [Nitrobacter winogradskyi Nb-255]
MRITRRDFLSASAGCAAGMSIGRARAAPLPRDPDVIVIGAGAAGIAAARRVQAANRTVLVLEAAGRIGGRCHTDTTTFGTPFDRGARWLFEPDTNPIIRLARSAGMEVFPSPLGQKIRIGRRNARAGETEQFLAALMRAKRAIGEAARRKVDVACASMLPEDLDVWAETIDFVLGASATGKDLKDLSVMDRASAPERNVAIDCRQGLGVLLATLGQAVPVSLSTPVTRVTWTGRSLTVETSAGRIDTRAVIVTVSVNVLTSGHIRFTPELPKRQLDAAARLSLGSYDRIALWLPDNPLGLGPGETMIEQSSDGKTALLVANAHGSSLCTVDIAGGFGRDLSAQGTSAMTAFATEWLTKLFGSDAADAVKQSATTRWNADPHVLGAMSAAEPGGHPSRKILMEPLGNLFLAGEAAHETLWGTVNGAWESGERAADAALRKIGASREKEPAQPQASKHKQPRAQRRTPSRRGNDAFGFPLPR